MTAMRLSIRIFRLTTVELIYRCPIDRTQLVHHGDHVTIQMLREIP